MLFQTMLQQCLVHLAVQNSTKSSVKTSSPTHTVNQSKQNRKKHKASFLSLSSLTSTRQTRRHVSPKDQGLATALHLGTDGQASTQHSCQQSITEVTQAEITSDVLVKLLVFSLKSHNCLLSDSGINALVLGGSKQSRTQQQRIAFCSDLNAAQETSAS